MKAEIHYLNTDLDLTSEFDLKPLVKALTKLRVHPLTVHQRDDGLWFVVLENNGSHRSPERSISAMLKAIETLKGRVRDLWDGCTSREFNIDYECGDRPKVFNQALKPKTLARMAAANVVLRITLYPADRGTKIV